MGADVRWVGPEGRAKMLGRLVRISLLGEDLGHEEIGLRVGWGHIEQLRQLGLRLLDLASSEQGARECLADCHVLGIALESRLHLLDLLALIRLLAGERAQFALGRLELRIELESLLVFRLCLWYPPQP